MPLEGAASLPNLTDGSNHPADPTRGGRGRKRDTHREEEGRPAEFSMSGDLRWLVLVGPRTTA